MVVAVPTARVCVKILASIAIEVERKSQPAAVGKCLDTQVKAPETVQPPLMS